MQNHSSAAFVCTAAQQHEHTVLVLQGASDPFGSPQDVRDAAAAAGGVQPLVVGVPGTHSFSRRADVRDAIVASVAEFTNPR